jgi:hypothetical protein
MPHGFVLQPGAYEDTADRSGSGGGGREVSGNGKGSRRGRRAQGEDGAWPGRDSGGFDNGFHAHAYHGKGFHSHTHGQTYSAQASEGAHVRSHDRRLAQGKVVPHGGCLPAAMAYPMPGVGYNYAAPPMFVGYTAMPASKADYQPIQECRNSLEQARAEM